MYKKTRVIIVVNKYWECDPVCWVLTNKYINEQCGIELNAILTCLTYPSYGPVKTVCAEASLPRLTIDAEDKTIEVWCISDLLSGSPEDLQSSSEEKMRLLPIIFEYDLQKEIELVIAVGTASSGPGVTASSIFQSDNINGSVVIGSKVFMHNGGDANSKSHYNTDSWDEILESGSTSFIEQLKIVDFSPYNQLMLCPPTNPSTNSQQIYVDKNFIALGDVNVTDYTQYAQKDGETGSAFKAHYPNNENGVSMETTHCLIYKAAKNHLNNQNPPFLFVSGEVDRFTQFATDVNPKVYAQNVSGAHNAGVAVAIIVSMLNNESVVKLKKELMAEKL
ncbi:hypothetical protein DWB61_06125 [Ancylomarina euxinus]|uniref:Nucleoside phosphorylase domain-containing protein n=1 Tax=Ancylomarina euxinus TaxID=2283627 RepID=A0A425Y458_9BACT|nr:hypothetical protein [Ancylomarina euxinus]MCZ4694613.1 hypothetical protein [Ancylomarina euxinus]MUP14156.1 hypothetical protein [Ancylomarina euxinus]RRG23012.1 hypothetical protein DWB61_06125 [Ancylomarina euxinus]